ncbi:MAG TPA: glycine cleavage system aminomethyltransferase GcvT [Paracoccaceae bacterium]|nr:glycine cleavage system aminomethyltransferase GcvT [Paracoccaceae bacterium]
MDDLLTTPLRELHKGLGARMVPFAGYSMPVQYPAGILREHLHTRAEAGLFDVSHMGQVILRPKADMAALSKAFEAMMPVDVAGLAPGRQRYGLFTNDRGGILDDLMFANRGDHLFVVVNAACKAADLAHMAVHLSHVAEVLPITDRALLALQGPLAEAVLAAIVPAAAATRFMDAGVFASDWGDLWVSRSGYTGEDGFEISVPDECAVALAETLLGHPSVAPVGLGARDTLRLEAGLCLYGHDIFDTTTPVEAGLGWAIPKVRRTGGDRAGGFPGEAAILRQLAEGAPLARVGLLPEGRAPLREGDPLFSSDDRQIGTITSGGFGPSLNRPIAMGIVPRESAAPGTVLRGGGRRGVVAVTVTALPFHPHSYKR